MHRLKLIPFFKLDYMRSGNKQFAIVSRPNSGDSIGAVYVQKGFYPYPDIMLSADELKELAAFVDHWEGEGNVDEVQTVSGQDIGPLVQEMADGINEISKKHGLKIVASVKAPDTWHKDNLPAGARMSFNRHDGDPIEPWDFSSPPLTDRDIR